MNISLSFSIFFKDLKDRETKIIMKHDKVDDIQEYMGVLKSVVEEKSTKFQIQRKGNFSRKRLTIKNERFPQFDNTE